MKKLKNNIFKAILVVLFLTCMVFMTGCDDEEATIEVSTVNLYRTLEEYTIGEFDVENYSFMIQYENGTKKEVFLTEEMISDYDKLQLKQEGTHTFTATVMGKKVNVTVTAKAKQITGLTLNDVTGVYNGKPYETHVEGTLPAGAKVEYPQGNSFTNAGDYPITAVVSCENYETLFLQATITIEKATYDLSSFTFENKEVTYDGTEKSLTIQGTIPEELTSYYTISESSLILNSDTKANSAKNAGIYYVTLHLSGDKVNYNTDNLTIQRTLTINKKEVEMDTKDIHMDNMIVDFDGQFHSIKVDEEKLPEGVNVEYRNNNQINAGVYTVTALFTLDENKNYTIIGSLSATLTINKIDYDMKGIKLEDATYDYDGASHSIVYSGNLPNGVELEYYENNNQVKAGVYKVVAHFITKDNNHNEIPTMEATMTINKASFTSVDLSMESGIFDYDGSYHEVKLVGDVPAGVQANYKVWNEEQMDMAGITKFKDVGVYTIIVEFKFEKENYDSYFEISPISATVVINRRSFDKDKELGSLDKSYTYDGTNKGTINEVTVPSWISIKKYTLLDNNGKEIEEAIGSNTYYYYYTFEYFDGVDTIVSDSNTGKITINPIEIEETKSFELPSWNGTNVIYSGEKLDYSLTFDETIYTDELANDINYVIYDKAKQVVNDAIDVGSYEVVYTFTSSTNYSFVSSTVKATVNIINAEIDCSKVVVEDVQEMVFNFEDPVPVVSNLPPHVTVKYSLKSSSGTTSSSSVLTLKYKITLEAEENYTLKNDAEYNVTLNVTKLQLNKENNGYVIEDGVHTYEATTGTYKKQGLVYEENPSKTVSEDTSYNNNNLTEYTFYANGSTIKLSSVLVDQFGEGFYNYEKTHTESLIDAEATIYYVPEGKSFAIQLLKTSSAENCLSQIDNFELFYQNASYNFNKNDGTPYGTYYIYYHNVINSEKYIINSSGYGYFGVLVVHVNKVNFTNSYFPDQSVEWQNIDANTAGYSYDLDTVLETLPTGITVDLTKSVLTRSYNTNSIKIVCKLNKSIFGSESATATPNLTIEDRKIDISKIGLGYKTIIYDGLDHKSNWGSLSLMNNVSDILKELIEEEAITVTYSLKDSSVQEAIKPGNYGVVATFSSNVDHLSIYNSSNLDKSATLSSILIIQAKTISENDILEEAASKLIISSYQNDEYSKTQLNTASTIDDLEKQDGYVKGLSVLTTVKYTAWHNELCFLTDNNKLNYPVAGLTLTSIEKTSELGDEVYSTDQSMTILNCTDQPSYIKALETPVHTEYWVMHFTLNDCVNLKGTTSKTFDLYLNITILSLNMRSEEKNLTYSGFGQTLAVQNQEELNKYLSYKYGFYNKTKGEMEYSNNVTKVAEIGTYTFGLYCYSFDNNGDEVCVGFVEEAVKINKIVVESFDFDKYLIKEMDWTNEDISVYNVKPGFSLPSHVKISSFTDSEGSEYMTPFTKREIGSYYVTIMLELDDEDHYEFKDDSSRSYKYEFTITKAHIVGYLALKGSDKSSDINLATASNYYFLEDNPTITFHLESYSISNLVTVAMNYKKTGASSYINDSFSNDDIVITDCGSYYVKANITILAAYKDKVTIGYYNNKTWVDLTKEIDNIVVSKRLDASKFNIKLNDVSATGSFLGKFYDDNKVSHNCLFFDLAVDYNYNGYTLSLGALSSYYKLANVIYVNDLYNSSLIVEKPNGVLTNLNAEANSCMIVSNYFAPGEYWIAFEHDTTVALSNDYYVDGSSYNYYLGIHLTIK